MPVVDAPAKLTLNLRIAGVRADGYHLIDAEMVTLELADTLRIEPRDQSRIASPLGVDHDALTGDGPFADGMPLDDANLVTKALRLVNRRADVHITKMIPHGGGLGGGSSDAAAVLRWAGFTDLDAASRLGADVAFCLVGGRARVHGIGEIVDSMPFRHLDITLVMPPLAVSTSAAYRAWDDLGGPTSLGPNDLETAAIKVTPALAGWRDRIAAIVGAPPTLAGSGATWFVVGHRPELAQLEPDATVVYTRTRP